MREYLSASSDQLVTHYISLEVWATSLIFSGFLGVLKLSFFFFIFKIMTEKSSAGPYYETRKWAQFVFLEIFIGLVLEVSGPWL